MTPCARIVLARFNPTRLAWRLAVRALFTLALLATAVFAAHPAEAGQRRQAALVIDAVSGQVLYAENADLPVYPASLTKMMTLYLAFDAIKRGQLSLDQKLPVSAAAASMPASKLGLKAGSTIVTRVAILALVTKSANDAAVVVAEAVGGSEKNFARLMTQKAHRLGMKSTTFRNASGLPDTAQLTTARDMVTLGRALMRDHPTFFPYFSRSSMVYGRRVLRNHNRLMESYMGMDCCKTGYINASGFNLVASARRDGRRLMAAVFGGSSAPSRDKRMALLLDQSFAAIGIGTPPKTQVAAADAKPATKSVKMVAAKAPAAPVAPAAETKVAMRPSLPPKTIDALISNLNLPEDEGQGDRGRPDDDLAGGVTPAGDWSIQVGAFASRSAGNRAIDAARKAVPVLAGADRDLVRRGNLFRARISGIDRRTAETACAQLKSSPAGCLVIRAD